MVATPDGVWVSNTDAPAVQRIDQRSNAVVATLEDAGTTPDGLVEFDGAVWVASDPGPQLHRIDPTNATVDGAFWIPLFNQGEVGQVEPPAVR
jgi:streptogramin lyase